WLFATERRFADAPGRTTLRLRVPKVRLNVGSYSLTLYLSEPPGGRFFEELQSVCPFEVVRLGESVLWGWRPEACVYHEEGQWAIEGRRRDELPEPATAGTRS